MDGWIAATDQLWLFASKPVRTGNGWVYTNGKSSYTMVPREYAPNLQHYDPPVRVRICAPEEGVRRAVHLELIPMDVPWRHVGLEVLTELE